jgi:hypothetical protein
LNAALRVLILTPTALPDLTGNAISAERWRRALSEKGIVVKVIETQDLHAEGLVGVLDRFRPHVVHAHHISRAGALMLDPLVAEKYGHLPFVVSPGGTDINLHAMKGAGMKIVGKTCRRARFIIAQSLFYGWEKTILIFGPSRAAGKRIFSSSCPPVFAR